MTARSIATVSLSGSLDETTCYRLTVVPATSDSSAATLVSQFAHSSRFEISRACPSPSAPATSQEPNASST